MQTICIDDIESGKIKRYLIKQTILNEDKTTKKRQRRENNEKFIKISKII
jgi:hypothetical protein